MKVKVIKKSFYGNTLNKIATVANAASALNNNNQQQGNTLNTIEQLRILQIL